MKKAEYVGRRVARRSVNSKPKRVLRRLSAVICLCVALFAGTAFGEENDGATTVEYTNLRELLKSGNVTLKQAYKENQDNIDAYQEMWDTLKWEQGNMEDRAEDNEADDKELAGIYSSNAAMLKSSSSRIYSQLKNMTAEKSTRNLEKSADSYTLTAQTLMNSYNQMTANIRAGEKTAEAAESSYAAVVKQAAAGGATSAQVEAAEQRRNQSRNSLASLMEEQAQLKTRFLTLLGLAGENAVIGTIPEPDLAAISAIDFETDKAKAVNNSSSVQSVRHTHAYSTADINRKLKKVDEAEGTAELDITSAYENLKAKRLSYEAAMEAFQSAALDYGALQRKQQAGMLSKTEYLEGEAEYLSKEAAKETAAMNLVQSYEAYCWEVKGVIG